MFKSAISAVWHRITVVMNIIHALQINVFITRRNKEIRTLVDDETPIIEINLKSVDSANGMCPESLYLFRI